MRIDGYHLPISEQDGRITISLKGSGESEAVRQQLRLYVGSLLLALMAQSHPEKYRSFHILEFEERQTIKYRMAQGGNFSVLTEDQANDCFEIIGLQLEHLQFLFFSEDEEKDREKHKIKPTHHIENGYMSIPFAYVETDTLPSPRISHLADHVSKTQKKAGNDQVDALLANQNVIEPVKLDIKAQIAVLKADIKSIVAAKRVQNRLVNLFRETQEQRLSEKSAKLAGLVILLDRLNDDTFDYANAKMIEIMGFDKRLLFKRKFIFKSRTEKLFDRVTHLADQVSRSQPRLSNLSFLVNANSYSPRRRASTHLGVGEEKFPRALRVGAN